MKGSVYKRCKCQTKCCKCNSSWAFMVDVGTDPRTGKRKQKGKSGFKTQRDAQAALTLMLNELHQGMYAEETNITFEEFAKDWLEIYSETNGVKPGTIRIREHEISKLMPYFAS